MLYAVAQGVEVLDFDTSLPGSPLLIAVRERYLQVGGLSKELVIFLKEEPSGISDIEAHLRAGGGDACTEGKLHQALSRLMDLAVLEGHENPEGEQSKIQNKRSYAPSYFILKFPVLPEKMLRPLTSRLAPLFDPRCVRWILPTMLLTQLLLWLYLIKGLLGLAASLRGYDYAILLVGNYLGLVLHELGHASACNFCRVRHGPIGFGIYLIFPAFYTDVTAAWRLPRFQRILVDAGGIYMNLLAATVLLLAYDITHRPVFIVLAGLYDVVVWVSLWPFVRMDGYWLISDLLGIPNLMNANRELTNWLIGRVWRRKDPAPPILSVEPGWARSIYFLYYTLFLVSALAMAFGLSRWYLPRVARSVPRLVCAIVAQIRATGLSMELVRPLGSLVMTMVPLFALSRYLLRGARFLLRQLKGVSSWFFQWLTYQRTSPSSGGR